MTAPIILVVVCLTLLRLLWRVRLHAPSTKAMIGVDLSNQAFEDRLMRGLRHQGYLVEGVQGPLLAIRRSGEITLVSYRDWGRPSLSAKRIRALRRAMRQQHAAGGKLVCGFEPSLTQRRELASGAIDWIGAEQLCALLQSTSVGDAARERELVTSFYPGAQADLMPELAQPEPAIKAPSCPRCGSGMTHQVAQSGAAVGQSFWRCVHISACKGIRPA